MYYAYFPNIASLHFIVPPSIYVNTNAAKMNYRDYNIASVAYMSDRNGSENYTSL